MNERVVARRVESRINPDTVMQLVLDIDLLAHQMDPSHPASNHTPDEKVFVTDRSISGQDIIYELGWLTCPGEQEAAVTYAPAVGILYGNGSYDQYSLHDDDRVFHEDEGEVIRGDLGHMFGYLSLMHGAMTSDRAAVSVAVRGLDER